VNITKKLSPNKYNGRNGWKPDMIVCHITEGSYEGAISWLTNPASKASAHFVVAKDGRITQFVELTDGSWCNGTSTDPNSKVYYGKSTLKTVRERKTNANYYTVSIEHEGIWAQSKGKLTDAQLAATIELIKYIRSEVKRIYGIEIPIDREHIVGHYQINPITKPNCPGSDFQFDAIIAALKGDNPATEKPAPKPGALYKVQVGAYSQKANAEAMAKRLKADGFDCFITTEAGTPAGNAQAPATAPTLKAGSKVKVKNTATKYSTGQTIPNWVKGNTYTVQQIGNGRILLKEIVSWVNTSDVEVVG